MTYPATATNPTPIGRRRFVACIGFLGGSGLCSAQAQGQQVYKLVYANNNFEPYVFFENGEIQGTLPAVLNELLVKRLKLSVQHSAYPWARAQAMVKAGQADGFVTAETPERLQYTVPTNEWLYQTRLTLFTRSDHPQLAELQKLRSIAELADWKIGSYMGHGWVQAKLGHLNIQYATDRETAMRMLLAKRFDVTADVSVPARNGIKKMGLNTSVVELPITLDESEARLCIGKESPLLNYLKPIDDAIRAMKADGTLARIFAAI
jgi:polar amino acid transport system substrate-binding protein